MATAWNFQFHGTSTKGNDGSTVINNTAPKMSITVNYDAPTRNSDNTCSCAVSVALDKLGVDTESGSQYGRRFGYTIKVEMALGDGSFTTLFTKPYSTSTWYSNTANCYGSATLKSTAIGASTTSSTLKIKITTGCPSGDSDCNILRDGYTWTKSVTVPTGYAKLSAPSSVRVSKSTATTGSSVTVSWSSVSNATGNTLSRYRVQGDAGSGFSDYATTTRTSISAPMPSSAGSVKFRVRAEGSAGSSYYSNYTTSSAINVVAGATWNSSTIFYKDVKGDLCGGNSVNTKMCVAGKTLTLVFPAYSDANTLYYKLRQHSAHGSSTGSWVYWEEAQSISVTGTTTEVTITLPPYDVYPGGYSKSTEYATCHIHIALYDSSGNALTEYAGPYYEFYRAANIMVHDGSRWVNAGAHIHDGEQFVPVASIRCFNSSTTTKVISGSMNHLCANALTSVKYYYDPDNPRSWVRAYGFDLSKCNLTSGVSYTLKFTDTATRAWIGTMSNKESGTSYITVTPSSGLGSTTFTYDSSKHQLLVVEVPYSVSPYISHTMHDVWSCNPTLISNAGSW